MSVKAVIGHYDDDGVDDKMYTQLCVYVPDEQFVHGMNGNTCISSVHQIVGTNEFVRTTRSRNAELFDIGEKLIPHVREKHNCAYADIVSAHGKIWGMSTDICRASMCKTLAPNWRKLCVTQLFSRVPLQKFCVASYKLSSDANNSRVVPVVDLDESLTIVFDRCVHIHQHNCDYFDAKFVRADLSGSDPVSLGRCIYYDTNNMWECVDYRDRVFRTVLAPSDSELAVLTAKAIDDNVFAAVCTDSHVLTAGEDTAYVRCYDVRNMSHPVSELDKIDLYIDEGMGWDANIIVED